LPKKDLSRYVDDLGFWNPHTNKFSLDGEKINKWLKEGAQPTDTVHNLLVKAGILKGPKIAVHKKSKKVSEQGSGKVLEKESSAQILTEANNNEAFAETAVENH